MYWGIVLQEYLIYLMRQSCNAFKDTLSVTHTWTLDRHCLMERLTPGLFRLRHICMYPLMTLATLSHATGYEFCSKLTMDINTFGNVSAPLVLQGLMILL